MALVRKLRDRLATEARALPIARHAWARFRHRRYEGRIRQFLADGSGRADRLPMGAVYEATMENASYDPRRAEAMPVVSSAPLGSNSAIFAKLPDDSSYHAIT